MNNKKKKIINTSILLVSLFAILLGSMVISSKFNKESNVNNVENIDSGSDEGEIGAIAKEDCYMYIYTGDFTSAKEVDTPTTSIKCDGNSRTFRSTSNYKDGTLCRSSNKNSKGKYYQMPFKYSGCAQTKAQHNATAKTTTSAKYAYVIGDRTKMDIICKKGTCTSARCNTTKGNCTYTVTGKNNYQVSQYASCRDKTSSITIPVSGENTYQFYACATNSVTTPNTESSIASAEDVSKGKIQITCSSAAGACQGNLACVTSKGQCSFTAKSTDPSYYVSQSSNCTTKEESISLTAEKGKIYKFYACNIQKTMSVKIVLSDGTSSDDTVGSVTMYDKSGNVVGSASGLNSFAKYACNSASSCFTNVAANPVGGYYFVKFSSSSLCSDSLTSSNPGAFNFTSNKLIYACFAKSSSGGSTGGGTYTPIQEPTVDKNTTVKKEAFFYSKGSEYQGDSIKCGDKIYITECTNDNDPICDVTSINGKTVGSTTKIRFSNVTSNEKDTGCYQEIKRYIAKKTSYYTNRELNSGKTDISCGEIVTFKQDITTACVNKSCEVIYNNKTVYVNIDDITSDKPACQNQDETKTCETSKEVTNAKGDVTVSICKNDDSEEKRNNIVKCADGYEVKYKLSNDTCKDNTSDNCYKEYVYTCSAISKPGISASGGVVNSNGKGIINVTGTPYGDIPISGYYVSSGEEPTENSNWSTYNAVNNKFSIERTAGTYFIWAMNNKHKISYPVLAKVYDSDLSTTLATFGVKDSSGNDINVNMSSLDGTVGYYETIVDSKYALLSNNLIADSVGGFDKLTTSYELSVNSNKIALYATLTSSDASYVSGYEPRTIDLEYGRNVALIKIVNKDGKERCYTFIINRVDDRNNSNLLKNIKLSRGSIDFDPYVTNYEVTISRFTKKVSVNAELDSATSTFIAGYEPREVEITEDNQSVVLKVISEAGSIRSYVITFNRKGEDKDTSNSTYLSSLTVPGTMLGFDKETYDYTITVPYEMENVPIYAFAESETASVTVGNNTGLKVGNNLIQIEVKNNNKTRIYSLHVIRKESGLDISDSAKLGTLSIKNYNLEFSPDKLDYEVKIKREKTLLITATPESNRADIYMYGNNDLTGFSTVRVKVIAENGLTNIYSIDIQKDAYNKKIEIIAASAGIATVVLVGVIIYIKKKHDKKKEYLEG